MLANVDMFIIRVGFGLANVDTICTLTRHEHDPLTRIATPRIKPSKKAKRNHIKNTNGSVHSGLDGLR